MLRSEFRLTGLAFVVYAGYAAVLLHPLWAYNGTHVAGYDYFNYNWNFWWIRFAPQHGLDIYLNNFVMFPALSNYGYHALTAFWYPAWALLEPFWGTLTSINVIITTACILNGLLLFIWLRSEGIHPALALLSGVMLQTLPITRYWYYNTHLNLMDWFWIPGLLLLWKGIWSGVVRRERLRITDFAGLAGKSLIFGVALWALLLTDLQFPIFASFIVVPYGLLTVWRILVSQATGRLQRLVVLALCAAFSIGTGIALMWLAGPLPYILRFTGELIPGPVEDRPGIAFPDGWLGMAERWWSWDQPSVSWFVTLAVIGTAAAALAIRRTARNSASFERWLHWFWLAAALPPFVLALGPSIRVGEQMLPLPFVWMYDLTGGNFRMPWRLAPAGVIAACMFMGYFWTPMFNDFRRRLKIPDKRYLQTAFLITNAGLLLLSAVAIRLFETAPLDPVLPEYHTYALMADDVQDYVVMEVPTGMGTGEVLLGNSRAIQYQWYGITHQKRMVNGFISRAPIDNFYYVETDDALLSWLGQRRLLEPDLVRRQLAERIESYPIGYIVLHTDEIERQSRTATEEIVGYFNTLTGLLCPPLREGAALFYRTRWHPAGCESRIPNELQPGVYEIDMGSGDDRRFIGWGWHYAEPVGGIDWRWMGFMPQTADSSWMLDPREAVLIVELPPGEYRLSMLGQSYDVDRTLQIIINGLELGEPLIFTPEMLSEQESDAFMVNSAEPIIIRLIASDTRSPSEAGQGDDSRQLSIAVDSIRFERAGTR